MGFLYEWRGEFENAEVDALHAEGFGHRPLGIDWNGRLRRHSLGWVCARHEDGELVGFVNVPWDGDTHAFVIDTLVAPPSRRQGVATRMIEIVVAETRRAGCEWLHVDFEDHLRQFYFDACGFTPSNGGVVALSSSPPQLRPGEHPYPHVAAETGARSR